MGCDSFIPPRTACDGGSLPLRGRARGASGGFVEARAAMGCDSFIPPRTACDGGSLRQDDDVEVLSVREGRLADGSSGAQLHATQHESELLLAVQVVQADCLTAKVVDRRAPRQYARFGIPLEDEAQGNIGMSQPVHRSVHEFLRQLLLLLPGTERGIDLMPSQPVGRYLQARNARQEAEGRQETERSRRAGHPKHNFFSFLPRRIQSASFREIARFDFY